MIACRSLKRKAVTRYFGHVKCNLLMLHYHTAFFENIYYYLHKPKMNIRLPPLAGLQRKNHGNRDKK